MSTPVSSIGKGPQITPQVKNKGLNEVMIYTVKPRDNLTAILQKVSKSNPKIAELYNKGKGPLTPAFLAKFNNIANPNVISPGRKIKIPTRLEQIPGAKTRKIVYETLKDIDKLNVVQLVQSLEKNLDPETTDKIFGRLADLAKKPETQLKVVNELSEWLGKGIPKEAGKNLSKEAYQEFYSMRRYELLKAVDLLAGIYKIVPDGPNATVIKNTILDVIKKVANVNPASDKIVKNTTDYPLEVEQDARIFLRFNVAGFENIVWD